MLWVSMVAVAAACSGPSSSDDDDDDDSAGTSGSSGRGGSSSGGKGGSSTGGTGGNTTGSGGSSSGSSGSSGSGGSSGGTFVGQCNDVCDKASVCPDADPASCSDGCDQFDALVASNICKAEIEALYDCGSSASNICDDTVCSDEGQSLVDCLVAYCTANPSAAFCSGG